MKTKKMKYEDCILEKIVNVKNTKNYLAILKSVERTDRYLVFTLGDIEANLLNLALNEKIIKLHRPDTFDLYFESMKKTGNSLNSIYITEKEGMLVKSEIEIRNLLENHLILVDSRPSDAIILATKNNIPIQVNSKLLENLETSKKKAVETGDEDILSETMNNMFYQTLGLEKLKERLQKMILEENYEEAQKIKEVIDSKINL